MSEPQLLFEEAIAEIERDLSQCSTVMFPITVEMMHALIQTVRAAWADSKTQREQYNALDEDWKELDAENAALREQLAESERLLARAAQRMMRINVNYRQASGLPLRLQAYCMRSEAAVGIGVLSEEEWQADLDGIEAGKPYPDAEEQP